MKGIESMPNINPSPFTGETQRKQEEFEGAQAAIEFEQLQKKDKEELFDFYNAKAWRDFEAVQSNKKPEIVTDRAIKVINRLEEIKNTIGSNAEASAKIVLLLQEVKEKLDRIDNTDFPKKRIKNILEGIPEYKKSE